MDCVIAWINENRIPFWTIVTAAIACSSCALVGCYLVLRRMSLLGDAVSHAVLPGLVIAFLITHSLSSYPMFIGAVALGVLTAVLTQGLHAGGRVPEDASMGVVFTSLFALGVVLLSNFARDVHLDTDCVLYGDIASVPLKRVDIGPLEVPTALGPLCLGLVATLAFITLLWKELKIASFDPALATAMGYRAIWIHYLLMALTAAVAVAAFVAVGSILVVAMLIVPAATAHLLTDRLGRMLLFAVLAAVASSVLGYWSARALDTTVAGMMAVAAGFLFTLAVLLAPRHGLLGRAIAQAMLSLRIVGEDIVALLYRTEELAGQAERPMRLQRSAVLRAIGNGLRSRLAMRLLAYRGETVDFPDGTVRLSDTGRRLAQSVVRSHRLWEAFLVEHFQLPLDHLHEPAERIEHFIGPQLQAELAANLAKPTLDPHGRSIPPPTPGDL